MRFNGVEALLLLALVFNADGFNNFYRGKYFRKDLLKHVQSDRSSRVESFRQIVDHFDPTNTDSWDQRYLVSEGNGTIAFLMIEGEGPMGDTLDAMYWLTLANEIGAWAFQLEHRFYGGSQPYKNLSTDALKVLSSDQALADSATFIAAMNERYQLGDNATWVAFGGSYAGSLVAWLRYKYPHLVHAAVSSSGPLEAKYDFGEYFQVVTDDFADHNQTCIDAISAAFDQIQEALANNETAELIQQLHLCTNSTQEIVEDPLQSANFYGYLTSPLALVAQYNGLLLVNITDVCRFMLADEGETEMERYGNVIENLMPYLSDRNCLETNYYEDVENLKNVTLEGDAGASGSRQWTYQTCTEFGFFQTSDLTTEIFGDTVSLDLYSKTCSDVFGDEFDEDFIVRSINNTNILKGSTNLEVTNVVFVHGLHDPWHTLGVLESSNRTGPVILIDGASHCNDMYSPAMVNSVYLEAARETIRDLVLEWVSN